MKKLFCFIAVALLVMVMASSACAAVIVSGQGGSSLGKVRTYTIINPDAGTYNTTLIPVTTIIPGKCEIVGWHINATNVSGVEGVASLRDSATAATAVDTRIINEAEASNTLPYDQFFPQGIEVARGVVVNQGPMTSVTVYYVQVRP